MPRSCLRLFFPAGGGRAALVQLPPAVFFGQKIGQGRKLVKKVKILKVLRIGLPIVENLSGLQESISSLSRRPQFHFGKKSKKSSNYIKFIDFPLFPLFGVPWAAVILGFPRMKCYCLMWMLWVMIPSLPWLPHPNS